LERRPYGSNRDTTDRRIYETPAEELRTHAIEESQKNMKQQFDKKR